MKSNEKLAQKMYKEIWHIYNTYSGYDYNDSMWCQAQGASNAWDIYEENGDWEGLVKEYVRHIKKIRILQESIPQELYC